MEASKNLALVLHAPKDIQLNHKSVPEVKGNEVLIEMKSVGICGTDVHFWLDGRLGNYISKSPMVLGHEPSGLVTQIGPEVKNLKVGDRVAIEPGVPCLKCKFCKVSKYNLCKEVVFCATPPYDGALCQYYKHDANFCLKLPDNVSYDEGAMLEPLAVAVYTCSRACLSIGDVVLILGAGPMGLMSLQVAKASGVRKVCITDICKNRLEMAKSIGADHTVLVGNDDLDALVEKVRTGLGCEPNKVIECSGAESSICLAIRAAESAGKVVLVGCGKPIAKIPLSDAALREVDIIGVFRYGNCYPTALSLIESGQVNVKQLITHHFDLKDSIDAFEQAKSGTGIKVIIHCNP